MEARLPAHLEVAGLIRRVQAAGGMPMVLAKGEREAGTILLVLCEKGENARLFERMPWAQDGRIWHCSRTQDADKKQDFEEYLQRRKAQDPDLWIVELDVADGERFIGLTGDEG